jgi:hypothetical protein
MGPGLLEILPGFIPWIGGDDAALDSPIPDAAEGANALPQGAIRKIVQTCQLAIRIAPNQLMVDVLDLHISNWFDRFDPASVGVFGYQRLDEPCFFGKVPDRKSHGKRVHIDISA